MSSRRLGAVRSPARSESRLPSLFDTAEPRALLECSAGPQAIEADDFPFEALSEIAELESWRKEINRPIYHIHKWWAQRLGSVFRGRLRRPRL